MEAGVTLQDVLKGLSTLSPSERRKVLRTLKPRKKVVLHPGSRRKVGLSLSDQRKLLEVAKTYFEPMEGEKPAEIPGSQSGLTDSHVYGMVWMMMHAGWHRHVLADPTDSPPTHEQYGGGARVTFTGVAVTWIRPKKDQVEGQCSRGIPVEDREWVAGFVQWLVEREGVHWMMVNRICWRLGRKVGFRKKLSPMTLRHTAGQNLARLGYSAVEIADMLNCTLAVARGYIHQAPEARVAEDEARGRLKAPGT
jgi:predicted DNA-binding antitoxin AbrB/MazE fold protein